MRLFGKAFTRTLLANGLALAVGPLCVLAQAQEYIDLEAERAASESRPVSASGTQAAQPAQAYPVTSYGIGTSARPEQSASTAPATSVAPAPVVASGANAGQLMLQVQQLQQEVMRLNGIVEEQAHELRTLKSQSLERYLDIDRRLSLLAGGSVDEAAPLPTESATSTGSPSAPAASAPVFCR